MSNFNIDIAVLAQALREGASQEDVANAFATALNQASATVKQERAIQKQKEADKAKAAQAVADFYNTYYPEMFGGKEKATGETIIKACDTVKQMAESVNKFKIDPKGTVIDPFSRLLGLQ